MRLILLFALSLLPPLLHAQVIFNGNFEDLTAEGKPAGWDMAFNTSASYKTEVDSTVRRQGRYAVSIAYDTGRVSFGAINYRINQTFVGRTLLLVGAIKTKNVEGMASLFLGINGREGQISQVDMRDQKLSGTNDWKEFYVETRYNEGDAVSLDVGAYLEGTGKVWIDSLRLYLDNMPISQAPVASFKALADTAFDSSSKIDTIPAGKKNTAYLTLLGQLWGFLKYHHPSIAKGNYNWDNELFRMLPRYLKCRTDAQVSALLEQWVDGLGKPDPCLICRDWTKAKNIAVKPDYGNLFSNTVFSGSLSSKLKYILDNHDSTYNYYVDLPFIPVFKHEKPHNVLYPDLGYRLLALYRYWNIIQYFCPNRNLIPGGWNKALPEFIPQFLSAKNKTEYALAVNRLIARIYDGHAFIESPVISQYQGAYRLPVAAHFIENKLVVTGYYSDTLDVKKKFKIGDIITTINGVKVSKLVKRYLPLMSSSNYESKLRDLPGAYLLKSNNQQFTITLSRNRRLLRISATAAETSKIYSYDFNKSPHAKPPGYYLISKDIGYIFGTLYKRDNLNDIGKAFKNTKGIIVDMRCYPSDEIAQTFGNYIKPFESYFVKFTHGSLAHPGLFTFADSLINGKKYNNNYTGKVIVIVNALTQSNAEFVTMALQSAPNVTVIGSQSAGADGNITPIVLPGMFTTHISGIGTYYPDGTVAQQNGVKIDYLVRPTIKGIKDNTDEALEKAKELIVSSLADKKDH